MAEERRKRTRVPVEFDLNIITQEKNIKVKAINISMSGVCFTSPHPFTPGDTCAINLKLGEEAQLTIEAKILRSNHNETIATFQFMDEETFYHLKRMIQLNAADADYIEKELAESAF